MMERQILQQYGFLAGIIKNLETAVTYRREEVTLYLEFAD